MGCYEKNNKLTLTEAMEQYNKKFKKGAINLINAHAGAGKSYFVFNSLIDNTYKFVEELERGDNWSNQLNRILYVCDTSMLQDSTLAENKKAIKLKNGSLIEARDKGGNIKGEIKVLTYSKLGALLKSQSCNNIILNNFKCIIFDEIQNLFTYCNKYNVDRVTNTYTDGTYTTVLDNLKDISKNVLCIGLSATPGVIQRFREINADFDFGCIRTIFNKQELATIRSSNFKPIYTNCIMNQVKTLNYSKLNGRKIYINTNTIKKSKEYKKYFESVGIKAEWLCSINNGEVVKNIDENGNEIEEFIPTMTKYQLSLRDRLLNGIDEQGTSKGTLPDDLDVIIVNSGYETGWNLKDDKVQICFIDNINEDYQVQARNRIRHDIDILIVKGLYDNDGIVLEKGQYGKLIEKKTLIDSGRYRTYKIIVPTIKDIDEKYIGIKLDSKLKKELVYKYAVKGLNTNVNFKSLSADLIKKGYIVKSYKNDGTYIFKDGIEVKKDSKKELKKGLKNMSNKDLYSYLDTLVGKKLYKAEQKELAINANIKRNGKLLKGSDAINAGLKEDNIPYVIAKVETDWERTLLDGSKNPMYGKVYWIVAEV